jgi:Mrp family chromosome partitioning ATPase
VGEKILLVDGNVRQPWLHSMLHCPMAPGLADVLSNPEDWQKSIQPTAVDKLHLIPSGTVTSMTFAALESSTVDLLITQFKETYDLILFTSPSVLGPSDAAVFGSKVDATCLVLTCGVSRLEAVMEARTALEAVHTDVAGVVLTGFTA